jgi:glutamate dehydrogenase (NAD(P)+)
MMDEYCKMVGHSAPGVITGKPIPLGGSQGRGDATARGGMYCIREAARVLGIELDGGESGPVATVAIQGFGNAGHFAHKLVSEMFGAKVVAVSDSKGGIYCSGGLDFERVAAHKQETGSVVDYQGDDGCRNIRNEDLLALDVEILIPAALEGVIREENAGDIRAKILAELANGPTTPEADEILFANGIFVIPDFLCNAGGVTVSYFEQVQNAYGYYWDEEMVYQRLDQKMSAAFRAVHQVAQRYRIHNRLAAYVVAVSRVAEACRLRGWV